MSGISSSTGLISGFDISGIVSQLMKIESRPLTLLQARVEQTNQQKLAYQTVNAQLMAIMASITRLSEVSAFNGRSVTSSHPEMLNAVAEAGAPVGSYSFLVRSIVSTHQLASSGFADRNATPVGAGTLRFESAQARVDPDTELAILNGGAGVRRGQIRITDRSGASMTVDLRSAYSVGDVLDAINSQTQVGVRAYISQDRLVIEDVTGLSAAQGQLAVANVGTGLTATDLGILGVESGDGKITSSGDLIRLTNQTRLASLNDGLGIRFKATDPDLRFTLANDRSFEVNLSNVFGFGTSLAELNGGQGVGAGTIRITNRAGLSKDIELTGNESISDINTILASDEYKDLNVTFSSASSSGSLVLSDKNEGTGSFKVEDLTGSIAAQLKLAGESTEGTLAGKANYQFNTIDSLIAKINNARDTDGNLNAGDLQIAVSADGKGLVLIDNTTGGSATMVEAMNGSKALQDLGFTGSFQNGTLTSSRLVSGINTVLLRNLNGGDGVRLGTAEFQLRDGSARTVDFSGAQTLQDVINLINAQGSLRAEVSAGGTGLVITDTSTGTGSFSVSGDTLADLGVTGSSAAGRLSGGDLNRKYISENTLLSSLNGGKGIGLVAGDSNSSVKFQIINSAGESATISLSGTLHKTIGDVINTINQTMASKGVQARVNASGDGLELYEETAAGAGRLKVTEVGDGGAAAALKLKGEASAETPGLLTGSFGGTIRIDAADTLDDVMNKINSAGLEVRASIVNDGSTSRPYRLILTSTVSGTIGQIAFSSGQSGLSFETLTEAQDARVVMGSLDSPNSIVVSSSSNKVSGLVQGLTIDLLAPGNTPITVNVSQNTDSIVNEVKSFVTAYNAALDRLDELTKFDQETNQRGILLGDGAILQIRDRLYRQVSRSLPDGYSVKRLTSVGLKFTSGGRLELNDTALRDAFEADPAAVKDLFTKVNTVVGEDGKEKPQYVGIAASLKQEIRNLTSGTTGLLGLQTSRLDERISLYNRRMEDMQKMLAQKETRLYAQFQAMEKALAAMQSQQSALTSLANMANSFSVNSK